MLGIYEEYAFFSFSHSKFGNNLITSNKKVPSLLLITVHIKIICTLLDYISLYLIAKLRMSRIASSCLTSFIFWHHRLIITDTAVWYTFNPPKTNCLVTFTTITFSPSLLSRYLHDVTFQYSRIRFCLFSMNSCYILQHQTLF